MLLISNRDVILAESPSATTAYVRNNSSRDSGGGDTGVVLATAILLSGPSGGEENVQASFTVSANGAIPAEGILVALAWSGVSVTGATATVTLTRAAPSAAAVVTPTSDGTLTLNATSSGYTSAELVYTVATPTPSVDFSEWSAWSNPSEPFATALTVATNPGNPITSDRGMVIQLEFDGVGSSPSYDSIQNVDAFNTTGKYNGSGTPTTGVKGVALSATALTKKDKNGVARTVVERIADPNGGGFWCFQHEHHKDLWHDPKRRWRSACFVLGGQKHPWGQRLWLITGLYFTAEMLRDSTASPAWDMFFSMHPPDGTLIGGGGFSLNLIGGNGNEAAAKFKALRTSYDNPDWRTVPSSRTSFKQAYIKTSSVSWGPIAVNSWHWFIIDAKQGCGLAHPTEGAVYGYSVDQRYYPEGVFPVGVPRTNGSEYFVRLYHAVGMSGRPVKKFNFSGFWQGPPVPTHSTAVGDSNYMMFEGHRTSKHDGQISNMGIYQKTNLLPTNAGTTYRRRIHTGHKIWTHKTGMTADSVLDEYRNNLP